jgi:hypothetical protein
MRTLTSLTAAAVLAVSLGAGAANAEPGGCLKYGAAGAVGGHLAGHGVLGAVGGCAAGMYRRHLYRKNQASEAAQQRQEQNSAQPTNGAYTNQPSSGTYNGATNGNSSFNSGSAFDNR